MSHYSRCIIKIIIGFSFLVVHFAHAGIEVDSDFGVVSTNIAFENNLENQAGHSIVQLPNGKLLVAGYTDSGPSTNTEAQLLLMRFNADGSRDVTFGSAGSVSTDLTSGPSGESVNKVILQSDGKIVIAGATYGVGSSFAILRYSSDGVLDNSFGVNGIVITDVPNDGGLNDVLQQPDGKLVVSGFANSYVSGSTFYSSVALARYNTNGTLDSSFGTAGIVITANGNVVTTGSIVQLSDGKFVVAAATSPDSASGKYDSLLLRYNNDGTLDTTFNGSGKVVTAFSSDYESVTKITVQADGKLVVAGQTSNSSKDALVARFNQDGSLDTGFDSDGILMFEFDSTDGYDEIRSIIQDADGKIVVTGRTQPNGGDNGVFAVARINSDGTMDTNFSSDGKLTTEISIGSHFNGSLIDLPYSIIQQTDGQLVVVGLSNTGTIDSFDRTVTEYDVSIVRYNGDGSLDTSFGNAGIVVAGLLGETKDIPTSIITQSDGKFIIAGSAKVGFNYGYSNIGIARYNADGSLDSSFNSSGLINEAISAKNDIANTIIQQADGKIVVAGSSNDIFTLARYTSAGNLDTSFSSTGIATTDFGGKSSASAMTQQTNGKLVVAGVNNNLLVLSRYNLDGTLDTSFDTDGMLYIGFGGAYDLPSSILQDANGKLVVAGTTYDDPNINFALVRYNLDGSLDTSFDFDGQVATEITSGWSALTSLLEQPDGKLVVTGYSPKVVGTPGYNDIVTARYNTDGSLDTSFGNQGKIITAFATNAIAKSVVLQDDGKIVVAGYTNNNISGSGVYQMFLTRYTQSGILDTGFGNAGIFYFSDTVINTAGVPTVNDMVVKDGDFYVTGSINNDFFLVKVVEKIPTQDDFGGDTKADILVRNDDTGQLYLYEMDGNARTGSNVGALALAWTVQGIGDVGGDSKADIIIRRTSDGYLYLFEMDGNTKTGSSIGALSTDISIAGLGDLGGDGKTDIVLRNTAGFLSLYEMDGNTVTASDIGPLSNLWSVEGLGDFGGDGKADLLIRNTTGQLYLYEMDGNIRTGSSIGGLPLGWEVAGIGDLGGDGKDDIIIRNKTSGQLYLYEMDGNVRTGSNIGGLSPSWDVVRVADYSGDGKADILVRNIISGQLYLYEMNGNARTGSNVGGLNPIWKVEVE